MAKEAKGKILEKFKLITSTRKVLKLSSIAEHRDLRGFHTVYFCYGCQL
ncbi:MAG: hypothetical protein ACQEP5_01550 [Actinomycetota bacterium]